MNLVDLHFLEFDWTIGLDGDLAMVDGKDALRAIIHRWLLTMPAEDPSGLLSEEREMRRQYVTQADREKAYDPPSGETMLACIPSDPSWGAGIKRYLSASVTAERLAEIETRVRAGLITLDGVMSSPAPEVQVSTSSHAVTIYWKVYTPDGMLSDVTEMNT